MKSCGLKRIVLLKCLLLHVRTSNDKNSVNLLLQSSKLRTCFLSPADKIIATIDLLPKLFGCKVFVNEGIRGHRELLDGRLGRPKSELWP